MLFFFLSIGSVPRERLLPDSGHLQIGAGTKKSTKHGLGTKMLVTQATCHYYKNSSFSGY